MFKLSSGYDMKFAYKLTSVHLNIAGLFSFLRGMDEANDHPTSGGSKGEVKG